MGKREKDCSESEKKIFKGKKQMRKEKQARHEKYCL